MPLLSNSNVPLKKNVNLNKRKAFLEKERVLAFSLDSRSVFLDHLDLRNTKVYSTFRELSHS